MPLDYLDRLDLACHSLTRTAGFSSRGTPTDDSLEPWLPTINPVWRSDPGSADRLAALARTPSTPSYGLHSLLEAAPAFLEWTARGWQFKGGTMTRKLLRLRLPLGTVHAAAAAREDRKSVGMPPTAIVSDDIRYRLHQQGAVDNHVHVGTCLPFDGMFELLQQQLRQAPPRGLQLEEGETAATFSDSAGVAFQSGHAIVTAALLGALLDAFLSGGTKDFDHFVDERVENPRFGEAVLQSNTWSFLHGRDVTSPGRRSWLAGAESLIIKPQPDAFDPTQDPYERATQRKLNLLRRVIDGNVSDAYIRCVEDLLRCEALVHFALLQGNRAGLREFLSVSNRLSRLRHSLPEQSRTVIQFGLPYLANAMRLNGIELRTAEQFDGHKGPADLARSLDAKLDGYEAAIERLDPAVDPPRATWPICLIKTGEIVDRPEKADSTDPGTLRFEMGSMFDLVTDTAELLIEIPAARKLISGFDVAGDESAAPSWCFALLFAVFDERLKTTEEEILYANAVRVHAGEDYYTPLQGLRRIYEAVTWVIRNKPYARLGHALALSPEAMQSPDREARDQPLDEAFDDLVWAWGLLRNRGRPAGITGTLHEAVKKWGPKLYREGKASPGTYLEAYEQRFDPEALRRLGVLARSAHHPGLELMRDLERPPENASVDQLMYQYLTRRELGSPCASLLLDEVLLREATAAVRPLVQDAVRCSGPVIEACPTSNLIIGGIDDYNRHPMHEWSDDRDLPMTINTDDPGLFSVTLADEYAHYWESSQIPLSRRQEAVERMLTMSSQLMPSLRDSREATATIKAAREQFRAKWGTGRT
jgi:Adenosine deaminase